MLKINRDGSKIDQKLYKQGQINNWEIDKEKYNNYTIIILFLNKFVSYLFSS